MNVLSSLIIILICAVVAYFIGLYFGIVMNWYVFMLLIFVGLFIQIILYVIRTGDVQDIEE